MLHHSLKALSISAALALVGTAAWAQSAPAPQPVTTRIGVTPQDAHEAVQKATPDADTGTLVRTKPSAMERAREMTHDKKSSPKPPKTTAPKTTPAQADLNPRANSAPPPSSASNNKTTGTVTNTTTPSAAMGITGTIPGAQPTTGDTPPAHDNTPK